MKKIPKETQLQTANSLVRDFRKIGIEPGMTLMVHSSLSAIGWVLGGAPTVVETLLEVVGKEGTLVMTAATPYCADPESWDDLDLPSAWLGKIRENLPVFDAKKTPTSLGAIPECFRTWPGTVRSYHPISSVCANGPSSREITKEHSLAFSEAGDTPYEKLYHLNASILLLGVGFNRCTALHFAESQVTNRRTKQSRFPIIEGGQRTWVEVQDMGNDNSTHFPIVGDKFVAAGNAKIGSIGQARSTLFEMKRLVSFGRNYFENFL